MKSGAGSFRTVRCSADEGDPLKRILTLEAINALEWMEDGYPNYHHQMMAYLQNYLQQGIAAGRFTREEAEHDLDFSLWMACACMNAGTYESYYRAWLGLRDTEKKAAGCGMWYYRYARAVMYLGRLEEALRYAEEGVRQQLENPWCWLMLGRLISGFISNRLGDRKLIRFGILLEFLGIALIALPLDGYLVAAAGFLLAGTGMGPVYPAIQHMAPANFGKRYSAAAIGLQMAFAYIGSMCMPTAFGKLQQAVGIWVLPAYLAVFAVLNFVLLEVAYKRIAKADPGKAA